MNLNQNGNQRTFIFSSNYFSDYKVIGDIRYYDTIEDIINYCKNDLLNTLKKNNFTIFIDHLKEINFNIHSHSFDEILLCSPDEYIYICDCNNCNNITNNSSMKSRPQPEPEPEYHQ